MGGAPAGSCAACLRIAETYGIHLGNRIILRNGHRGQIQMVNHFNGQIRALVFDEVTPETHLLPLEAVLERNAS